MQSLEKLIDDTELRNTLAQAGFKRVHREFSMERGIDTLLARLEQSLGENKPA